MPQRCILKIRPETRDRLRELRALILLAKGVDLPYDELVEELVEFYLREGLWAGDR